jgi:hypothetical protein
VFRGYLPWSRTAFPGRFLTTVRREKPEAPAGQGARRENDDGVLMQYVEEFERAQRRTAG